MMIPSRKHHSYDTSRNHEHNTRWVVIITAVTMGLEIGFGNLSNSMALMAEGWHMSTHVFSIGLTWLTYFAIRKYAGHNRISFRKEGLLALSGFTSAIVLLMVALLMAVESVERIIRPLPIKFTEAILIAGIGLVVNLISALFLHHDHGHSDHNIRAAYLHVLTDGLTSAMAIIALAIGMYYKMYALDAISGLIGSIVITIWAFSLIKRTGTELIDFRKK